MTDRAILILSNAALRPLGTVQRRLRMLVIAGFWLVLGILVGIAAAQRKGFSPIAGAIGGMLLGILSPLLYLVSADRQKCPYCASWIDKTASVCRHCGRDVLEGLIQQQQAQKRG
jgi:hypothetical protein